MKASSLSHAEFWLAAFIIAMSSPRGACRLVVVPMGRPILPMRLIRFWVACCGVMTCNTAVPDLDPVSVEPFAVRV